jgi:hypothetical protein
VLINKRFPRFTCSGVKVIDFVAFKGTVRIASSNSTAKEFVKLTFVNVKNAKMLVAIIF